MSKIIIDTERCKGCALCIDICPKKVIVQDGSFNSTGYNFVSLGNVEDCTGCGFCALMCPEAAIEVYRKGNLVAKKPKCLSDKASTYCPGCSHGVVHRLIAEIIDEENLRDDTIGVTSIGCSIFIYRCLDIDYVEGAHGRAPAVATGIKRVHPDKYVFTYQGDGDIGAIGLAEIMHAAIRNEKFTVIFINNGNYGMTGGQAAPTTMLGKVTTTTPRGKAISDGYPLKVSEILANLGGEAYIARGAVNNPKNIIKTKEYIRKAFSTQLEKKGFALVEVLGTCPSNWKMSAIDALEIIEDEMVKEFPLGEIKKPKER